MWRRRFGVFEYGMASPVFNPRRKKGRYNFRRVFVFLSMALELLIGCTDLDLVLFER